MRGAMLAALLVAACGGDATDAPPSLATLTLTPTHIPVGTISTVTIGFGFTSTADLEEAHNQLVDDAELPVMLDAVPLALPGQRDGNGHFDLTLKPGVVGHFRLRVKLLDVKLRASPPVDVDLMVE